MFSQYNWTSAIAVQGWPYEEPQVPDMGDCWCSGALN
jgi:hypothetical protein